VGKIGEAPSRAVSPPAL